MCNNARDSVMMCACATKSAAEDCTYAFSAAKKCTYAFSAFSTA
jgi:hypothetical protein